MIHHGHDCVRGLVRRHRRASSTSAAVPARESWRGVYDSAQYTTTVVPIGVQFHNQTMSG